MAGTCTVFNQRLEHVRWNLWILCFLNFTIKLGFQRRIKFFGSLPKSINLPNFVFVLPSWVKRNKLFALFNVLESCSMVRLYGIHGWSLPRLFVFNVCIILHWASSWELLWGLGFLGWVWCIYLILPPLRLPQSLVGASLLRFSLALLLGKLFLLLIYMIHKNLAVPFVFVISVVNLGTLLIKIRVWDCMNLSFQRIDLSINIKSLGSQLNDNMFSLSSIYL